LPVGQKSNNKIMDQPASTPKRCKRGKYPALFLTALPIVPLIALLTFPPISFADADDDDEPTPQLAPRQAESPEAAVRLTERQQQAAGLAIRALEPLSIRPEAVAYGKVLDLQPLLELRTRYRAALAEAEIAAASLDLARKNRLRAATLHREDIIAGRELAQVEAQYRTDQARDDSAHRLLREIRQQAQQGWGNELMRLALDGDAPLFEELVNRRRVLLLITLPAGYPPPERDAILFVARDHDRTGARRADPIAAAPLTDDLVQGETFFFHAAADRLRAGMRVSAWAPLAGETRNGVAVPLSAVVWQDGKPWVYRQTDATGFVRAEIAEYREYGGAWFVSRGLAPGDRIVVTGGQTLLSEELRRQIPDEADD
jgi:hypothetical protein